ncbi:Holliday junction resolvase RuvX [Candidatus Hodgkinia cicadicola]
MQNIQQHCDSHNKLIKTIGLDVAMQVGIAESTTNLAVAVPKHTLNSDEAISYLQALKLSTLAPLVCALGHPVTLNGKRSKAAWKVESAAEKVRRRLRIPVVLWNERLSSKWTSEQAHAPAAVQVLQSLLDAAIQTKRFQH